MAKRKKKAQGIAPGIHDLTEAQYHADPCPQPSLSASVAKVLIDRSPLHAWHSHPRLNPHYEPEEKEAFDFGTAAHDALLLGLDRVQVIDAPDWRRAETRAERDGARAVGRIPILKHKAESLMQMVKIATAAVAECRDLGGMTLVDGKPEQTVIWREDSIWCRSKLDWLSSDRSLILDYKTTSGSCHPSDWSRSGIEGLGGDVQAAFYVRGMHAVTKLEPKFVFLVQETEPPYECAFIGVPPSWLAIGTQKVQDAIAMWSVCVESGNWPGYTRSICWAEAPAWAETRRAERIVAHDISFDPVQAKHGLQP